MIDVADIFIKAASGDKFLFSDYDMAQKLMWYQANEMYESFRKGSISKDAGTELKKKIMSEYTENSSKLDNGIKAFVRVSNLYTDTERAMSDYRKNRTLENADRLCDVIDGFIRL